jgi:nucleoside-diphosphate-sugar epimerase
MRIFITGASGWIGSATVDELLAAGHEVAGLARSDASAADLQAKGARVRRGDRDDLASIRAGAEAAEAVIHLANKHDWSNPAASSASERAVVQAIGDALAGTRAPFPFASGVAGLTQGRPATESDPSPFHGPAPPRGGSENLALE